MHVSNTHQLLRN